MPPRTNHLRSPVIDVARRDFTKLLPEFTAQEALDHIRREGVGEKIVYFYVADEQSRLRGVLPTRRLLAAPLHQRISDLMIPKVIVVPQTATVMDVCDLFVLHKFLALPVVDGEGRIVGVVDVGVFTDEVFDYAQRERWDEVFESIGFRLAQVRDASPLRAFRFRFPWLLATIASGTVCALLASAFETTLARSLVLAFFLTLVLGLGESVSIQAMTITIQALRSVRPTLGWYLRTLRREAATAVLLGAGCGATVGVIVWVWRGAGTAAVSIGSSILLAILAACVFGLSIPTLLHALKLDPKIAAGPMTLALADIFTLIFYFGLAACLL